MKKVILIILTLCAFRHYITASNEELSAKEWIENVNKSNASSSSQSKEYREGIERNTPNTGGAISFNSKDIEYVDNVHSEGEYSYIQAQNQPLFDKLFRCFKIFFLKQYGSIESQVIVEPITTIDEAVSELNSVTLDTFNYEKFKKQNP